jgi:protein gp37
MGKTSIQWTDYTWNPIGGCSIESPGCINCYAQSLAGTRLMHHPLYQHTTDQTKVGPVFNGTMTVAPDDAAIWTWPLRFKGSKTPRRGPGARSMIFVDDMADLFHPNRPLHVIDKVYAVMALTEKHDFQVLTKRPQIMADYCNNPETPHNVLKAAGNLNWFCDTPGDGCYLAHRLKWPLPNVWAGTSAERQQEADERLPHLLRCKAAVRFVSYEPALGPVDLTAIPRIRAEGYMRPLDGRFNRVDWVICGGESGPDARPMHPDWARSLRDQCIAAGVPFFFKQWGTWAPHTPQPGGNLGGDIRAGLVQCIHPSGRDDAQILRESGGKRQTEQGSCYMHRIGKKAAGAFLDGGEWQEFPQ